MIISPGAEESYLLDDQGRIVVRSTDARRVVTAGIHDNEALELVPFGQQVVVDMIRERRSGYALHEGELVVFYRLHALGWYYAIRGPETRLLD